jgi:hypothetical protein
MSTNPELNEAAPIGNSEEAATGSDDMEAMREKTLDKTLADSFPASDPPSSIPDPSEDSFDS